MQQTSQRIWAAFQFFTRLPLWRIHNVPAEAFRHVVLYWPLAGWLTGGTLALSFLLFMTVFPLPLALLLALLCRLLLTGALHEDGLADFCDGMGGGTSRQRILEIMKDSHIGTFGVLGLLFYFAIFYTTLLFPTLNSLVPSSLAFSLLFGDVLAKSIGSFLIAFLPYARKPEEAKTGITYPPLKGKALAIHFLRVLLILTPAILIGHLVLPENSPITLLSIGGPLLTFLLLVCWIRKKLQGYTGDCCGALFLLCELAYHLMTLI